MNKACTHLSYWIIPFIFSLVVLIHLYNRNRGLNIWKGGGFGMYSDFDPDMYMITVEPLDSIALSSIVHTKEDAAYLDSVEYEVKAYPSEKNMKILSDVFRQRYNAEKFRITVWKPFLSVPDGCYGFARYNSIVIDK